LNRTSILPLVILLKMLHRRQYSISQCCIL